MTISVSTFFLAYVSCFSAGILALWLLPKLWPRATVEKKAARAFRCRNCGHVCFDLDDGDVRCPHCSQWNETS